MQDLSKIGRAHFVSALAEAAPQGVLYSFVLATVLQSFHQVEHIAQLYQHAILGFSIQDSHGILFFLDLEWNHFTFNYLYLSLLAIVFAKCGLYRLRGPARQVKYALIAFNLGFAIQAYHEVEHSVRIFQWSQTGCEPCKGILGWYLDGVYLHFALNTTVLVLPMIAFLGYGFLSRIVYSGRDSAVKIIATVIIASMVTMNIGGIVGTSTANPFGYRPASIDLELPDNPPPLVFDAPATEFAHTHGLAASTEKPGLLYVATHTGLVVGLNASDFVYQWFYLNTERMDITGFLLHPEYPFVVYTFGHPSADEETGMRVSYDRAQSWALVTTRPDPHQWVVSQSDSKVMYATDFPTNVLIRSDDGGANWKILKSPANVLSITVHPDNPDHILVGTDDGLYRSKDGGLAWEPIGGVLVNARISAVAYDPSRPEVIYVSSFFGMMKSSNGGNSWTNIANGISVTETVEYISVDPRNTNIVYAAANDKVYKSMDGGQTWTLIRGPDQG